MVTKHDNFSDASTVMKGIQMNRGSEGIRGALSFDKDMTIALVQVPC